VAYLARLGLEVVERRDGVRDPELRALVADLVREARVARYPSVVASVTSITEAPSFPRCSECHRPPADKLRKGLCDACYRRARRRGNTLAG
jgi:hypothetical protein